MSPPVIRPARPDDASALAELQSHLDAPAPELLASFAVVGTCLVSVEEAERSRTDASDDGDGTGARPVGYLLLIGGDDAHIAEVVVHPDYRREGRGRALLEAAIDRVEAGTRVTLAVAADNEAARSLYESVGFRPSEYRPEWYEDEEREATDAVIYVYEV